MYARIRRVRSYARLQAHNKETTINKKYYGSRQVHTTRYRVEVV